MYLSIYLSVCLSVCKLENEAILRDFLSFWTWQRQNRNNSARLLQFWTWQRQNETILRDFLIFRSWQHQKRNNSLRLPLKMESWVQSWRPLPMRFPIFPLHLSKVLRLPRQSDARSNEVLHLSRKIIFPKLKIWCSKMQPFSGNQRPDITTSLMNMSLVLRLPRKCILPDPLQMSHACHRFWKYYKKPSRFARFWKGAQSLAPATRNGIWTSKSGPNMCFAHFDLEMCFAPQRRALFSAAQLPKVVRRWGVLYILTSKCASRRHNVQRRAIFISHLASWLRTRWL